MKYLFYKVLLTCNIRDAIITTSVGHIISVCVQRSPVFLRSAYFDELLQKEAFKCLVYYKRSINNRVVALGETMHCVPKSFGRLLFEQKESSKKNRNH